MKRNVKTWAAAGLASLPLLFAGCTDKEDIYDPNYGKGELKPESEYFDFATTRNVAFDVNYGKIGERALIEVYTANPLTFNEDGSYAVNGEAVYKIFADGEGRFAGDVKLPTAVETVYVYSSNWGVPRLVEAKVENGKVVVDAAGSESRSAVSRVTEGEIQLKTVNEALSLYAIVDWETNGKLRDVNSLVSKNEGVDAKYLNAIKQTLWGTTGTKPSGLDNSGYCKDTKHVNVTIANNYEENGEVKTVENAKLSLTFVHERAGYENVIGYYYYAKDQVPDNTTSLKKFIIIPNASIHTDGGGYTQDDTPVKVGDKIELLYEKEDGIFTPNFPPGMTVGFFMIPDAFDTKTGTIVPNGGSYEDEDGFVYSNKEWNQSYEGRAERFISLSMYDGSVVYGIEDGSDTSYEDVMFSIEANPSLAIQDPDRPVIPDPEPKEETQTTTCTYAFEDIWPTGGDYDLNDVIVEHKRMVTFDTNNDVSKVEDVFTPVQPAGSATYVDAFAVQYTKAGTMTIPEGAVDETETQSVILFSDAKEVVGKEFTVTRTFDSMKKPEVDKEDLNPFVIANYVAGESGRTEIHMPKKSATSKASDEQGNADDAYYINKDGKSPFAITLPITGFVPVTETVNIANEYTDFSKWVESNGTLYTDWYKSKQK